MCWFLASLRSLFIKLKYNVAQTGSLPYTAERAVYKPVVLGREGTGFIRTNFPIKAPVWPTRVHLSRPATERHRYQLSTPPPPQGRAHIKRATSFSAPSLSGTL